MCTCVFVTLGFLTYGKKGSVTVLILHKIVGKKPTAFGSFGGGQRTSEVARG